MENTYICQVMLQIFVILLTAKLLGRLMEKIKLPSVVGEFLSGIMWGPTFMPSLIPNTYSFIFPKSMSNSDDLLMSLITMLGLISMLALSGADMKLKIPKNIRYYIFGHSIISLILAFLGGFWLVSNIPNNLVTKSTSFFNFGFLLSIAIAMSAVPIISRILNDWKITKTELGQLLMLNSMFVDFLGWLFLAAIIVVVTALHGSSSWIDLTEIMLRMVLGLVIIMYVGHYLCKWLEKYRIDYMFWPLLLGFCIYTHFIAHINLYLGGFLFGILVSSNPRFRSILKTGLNGFATEVFSPLFFAVVAEHCNLKIFENSATLLFSLIFLIIGFVIKLIPTILLRKYNSSWRQTWLIVFVMNARGGMEIFVAIAGMSLGIFNQSMYTLIVTTAVITAITCPLALHWYMKKSATEDLLTQQEPIEKLLLTS